MRFLLLILRELQVEFGGSYEAAGQTFAGQLDRLRNSALDLAETIGTGLLGVVGGEFTDVFENARNLIGSISGAFQQFFQNVENGMSPVQAFRFAFEGLIPPGFRELFNAILDAFRNFEIVMRNPETQASLRQLGDALSTALNQGLVAVLDSLSDSFRVFADLVSRSGPSIVTILETVAGLINTLNESQFFTGLGAALVGGAGQMGAMYGAGVPASANTGTGYTSAPDSRPNNTQNNIYGPVTANYSSGGGLQELLNDLQAAAS